MGVTWLMRSFMPWLGLQGKSMVGVTFHAPFRPCPPGLRSSTGSGVVGTLRAPRAARARDEKRIMVK